MAFQAAPLSLNRSCARGRCVTLGRGREILSEIMESGLSRDIILLILSKLDFKTLLSVSLLNHYFYALSRPLIFVKLHLTWDDISAIAEKPDQFLENDERIVFAKALVISADRKGEWVSSPKLSVIDQLCRNSLQEIEIDCAMKSSGWLKYIEAPLLSVRKLTLTCQSQLQSNSFDFAHIAQVVPNLESISLGGNKGGFAIDPFSDYGLRNLRHIEVRNCEWQYPSRICDAAKNSELKSLSIFLIAHMHPFAFSERFKSEFRTLPSSIQDLNIVVNVGKKLSWNPLTHALPLPFLKKANLAGFEYSYKSDESPKSHPKFPHLATLTES